MLVIKRLIKKRKKEKMGLNSVKSIYLVYLLLFYCIYYKLLFNYCCFF